MAERENCTGIAASWCPNCGTCNCHRNESRRREYRATCPLHGAESRHAETLCAGNCGEIVPEEGARCDACEVKHLRAIIEGRTTPPTDAEVYAHGGPGRSGWWLVSSPDDMSLELIEQPKERDWCIEWGATQWLPIDLDGRPCAWPTVEAPRV